MGLSLVILGGALLVLWLTWTLEGRSTQAKLAERLESFARPDRSAALLKRASATRREAKATGLVGRLELRRLGLSVVVVEGISARMLRRGVGHVPGTAFPGERGNVALAGHRDTYFGCSSTRPRATSSAW